MKTYTFKHRRKGLGIHNWIKSKTAVRPGTWDTVLKFFKVIIAGSRLERYPGLNYIYEFLMHMRPDRKKFTKGVLLNLNEQVTDQAENVVLPVELIQKAVRDASYITIMNRCICRDAQKCENYPRDFGCIFIGRGARVLEERQIGRKATVDEALAHIDRGVELGLIGHALWIEVEQYIWGMRNEDMHRFLEICFCCPCCCTALKLARNATPLMRRRFQSAGWKAVIRPDAAETCTHCLACLEACPLEAISSLDSVIRIDPDVCAGCGICAVQCPQDIIHLQLRDEIKADIKDYFAELDLDL